jgi:hypothetical protein
LASLALPVNSYIRTDGEDKRHWVIIPYIVKVNPEEARLNEPESMDAIGWHRLDTLPEPLHSGVKMDMEMYREFLKRYS